MTPVDPQLVRRQFIWSAPLLLGVAALCAWVAAAVVYPAFGDIAAEAPVVRLYAWGLHAPLVALLCVLTVVFEAAVILGHQHAALLTRRVLRAVFYAMLLAIAATLLFSGPLQRWQMPRHGYHACDLLDGQPSLWFDDWVRNPALCIKGATREGIRSQSLP